MNGEITKYVEGERANGISDSVIRVELLSKGWKEEDVDMCLGVTISSSVA